MYRSLKGSSIKAESKRKFYESTTENTVPGLPTQALPTEQTAAQGLEKPKVDFLQENIKNARLQLIEYLDLAKEKYVEQSEQYYKVERQVTDTLSSLHDKREELFPNSLYVLTGFLTGVVFTRRSNILVRATVPLVCGVTAFRVFLPSTFANVSSWFDLYQKKTQPDLWTKKQELYNKAGKLIEDTDKATTETEAVVTNYLEDLKKKVGTYAGLNVEQKVSEKKK
ncbi:hypothetical protein OGAPHI_004884 [Ogataea philodendri]|uniref:MICOS complex subunit n=1 Tax=Ogataea philodendri TaxID=1378263 RepID=A0A9P8P2S6_9ASCO|nr:uncharacterized protein OGAPHI_004884 [Ogataea philodendri]KAH3664170.1 hypothetical protein OGAPHI_004884 [Ogataea philodendri]